MSEKVSENSRENKSSEDSTLKLGESIRLSGFREVDRSSIVIIKKIVGNYVKRFSEIETNFNNLAIVMKTIHETEGSKKYEIHANLSAKGKPIISEVVDRNIFVAVDSALKKIESEISK